MCLFVKDNAKKRIAKRPITVYKHVFKDADGDIRTSYREFKIKLNKLYTSKLQKQTHYYYPTAIVDVGIHSFRTKRAALADVKSVGHATKTYYIVECTIPKGSSYYVGEFCMRKCYASDAIKYGKMSKVEL